MKKIIALLFALVLLASCREPSVRTDWKLTYSVHMPDTTYVKTVDFDNGDQYGRAIVVTNRRGTSNHLRVYPNQYGFYYIVEESLCPISIISFEKKN